MEIILPLTYAFLVVHFSQFIPSLTLSLISSYTVTDYQPHIRIVLLF